MRKLVVLLGILGFSILGFSKVVYVKREPARKVYVKRENSRRITRRVNQIKRKNSKNKVVYVKREPARKWFIKKR